MKDWSYKEALALAQSNFHACVMRHALRKPARVGDVSCSCGQWHGNSPHLWLEHVDEQCRKETQDGQSRVSRWQS